MTGGAFLHPPYIVYIFHQDLTQVVSDGIDDLNVAIELAETLHAANPESLTVVAEHDPYVGIMWAGKGDRSSADTKVAEGIVLEHAQSTPP